MSNFLNERIAVLFALLLLAASLFYASYSFDFSHVGSAHSPVFFPRIILIIWMGLTVIALLQAYFQKEANKKIEGFGRLSILVVATLIYSNAITAYGFFLSSVAFALVCLPVFGIRNPLLVAIYCIVVPGSLVVLFNHILGMPLPTSPFTYLF